MSVSYSVENNQSKYPSRMGKPWTLDEDNKLLESIKNGKEFEEIAREHERTEGGIWYHICGIANTMYNENRPMGEIMTVTSLSEQDILDFVKKMKIKDEKRKEENTKRNKIETTVQNNLDNVSKLEMLNLINDIQTKMVRLNMIVAMMK